MILGLDVSTSITGITLLDHDSKVIHNFAIDTRKYKDFFEKAVAVEKALEDLKVQILKTVGVTTWPRRIFIEQSLQTFRSGFSSAKTLSSLSRFNGIVSWLCYNIFEIKPEYIAATSARKLAGISVPKGTKGKEAAMKYVVDNVPDVLIEYTKHGNPRPECFDKVDSWVIAKAGLVQCQKEKSSKS